MNKTSKVKGVLEVLLVTGLILLIPLFFAIKTAADKQEAKNTPMPLTPTAMATFESNAVTTAKQPPACAFPLAQTTTAEAVPEEYIFSEPQVVLTAAKGNVYNIVEWLPDSQQVLMTEDLRNNFVSKNDNAPQQSISLYNPETGESKVYAIRTEGNEPPAWQPDWNAVVYPAMNYTSIDKKNAAYKFTRQLWVSYGDPDSAQLLADNLTQLLFAMKPGRSEMMYLSDKQISRLDKSLKKLPSAPFDLNQWDYKERRNKALIPYHMAWQPGTSLIFLYSNGHSERGGYTFILDTDTGHVCELDLVGWATVARWSSDGRYLAVGRATKSHPSDLTLLDTATGNLTTLGNAPQGMDGQFYVSDFIWAPDNRHLLAIGVILPQNNSNENTQGLYLVDFVSGQNVYVADYKSIVSYESNNWAWSPDGSKLLMRCPTHVVDRICLISVHQTGQ